MTTAKEFQASFGRRKPTLQEVQELHRLRDLEVAALSLKDTITVKDVQALEWGGRFAIANQYLDKCDEQARQALLHDPHHGVRSAAALFKPSEKSAAVASPAAAASTKGDRAAVADVAFALMNGKPQISTLYGSKTQTGVEEMILSTHPIDTLKRAEAFMAGFEGDATQHGIGDLLADVRAAIGSDR